MDLITLKCLFIFFSTKAAVPLLILIRLSVVQRTDADKENDQYAGLDSVFAYSFWQEYFGTEQTLYFECAAPP